MSDSDVKLVKVDNWGIYFLQRLKHFFNRTDYCDLTLQFQDNAQLKVHRLVLSACTEYFELLERTCEMYEDCLVMPDDLQADVVVPIVNFMYTGQLEFRMDLLERLYLTSQIMDMPVLTKLLDAHRQQQQVPPPVLKPNAIKRSYSKPRVPPSGSSSNSPAVVKTMSNNSSSKRHYSTAFGNNKLNKPSTALHKPDFNTNNGVPPPYHSPEISLPKKTKPGEPRPTRYELPEELDSDNLFDSSFTSISYTSQPLMVHPDSTKYYSKKRKSFEERAGLHGLQGGTSTLDIIECKKVSKSENIFEDENTDTTDDADYFQVTNTSSKVSNQLFDQIVDHDDGPKVTIETKDAKQAGNIDHAKIISEVLKKYPHLVKSNKNIKLKILNTPSSSVNKPQVKPKKQNIVQKPPTISKPQILSDDGYTYETDVIDSKEAAKLIAMGADNVHGPWICLICGTPGKAIHFTSYYKFRRHLIDIHNEKPVSNMCEYCGLKSQKRNYLLHHLLVKHGVDPPPAYRFPKCNQCNYVALTEGFLVKHKLSHSDTKNFRCNICTATYTTPNQLLAHIQSTGHKYTSESKKPNLKCIYCLRVFLRESNFYAHMKTLHKEAAKADGIIDDSDDEREQELQQEQQQEKIGIVKYEPKTEDEEMETQYQITPDGNIDVIHNKKQRVVATSTPARQKILNSGFGAEEQKPAKKAKPQQNIQHENEEEVVMIDNTEYIMRENQLIPKKKSDNQYVLSNIISSQVSSPSTSMDFVNIQNTIPTESSPKMVIKKATNINQPIQIVVSNEEEYKALMNTNHSIIFDDGDSNKTLTVLSTPHTTLNSAGLDLEHTQPGEMMIIPDNYPLNVSEAHPTDNSNIVVVYGHPVAEQNKQFQIITSQDIGSQFVQSSAVITQNYEAMTTTAPVMSAHVIDAQITQEWQNNDQNEPQVSQLQELTQMTVIHSAGIEQSVSNALSELPEVSLTPKEPEVNASETILQQDTDDSNEVAEIIDENSQQAEEVLQIPLDAPMDVDETETDSTQVVIDNNTVVEDCIGDTNEEMIVNNESTTQDNEAEVEDAKEDEVPNTEQDSQEFEELVPETDSGDVVLESTVPPETVEVANTEDKEVDNVETDNVVDHVVTDNAEDNVAEDVAPVPADGNRVVTEIAKEQIQSLTADWSEDEYDTEGQEQVEESTTNNVQESVTETDPQDVEESIESIQQEMEKQMNVETEGNEDEPSDLSSLVQPTVTVTNTAPQEKISSLLNDWDENDSQEENDTADGGDENISNNGTVATDADTALKEGGNSEVESANPKKDDKIQSLVSDWDEDEEESKN